MSIDKTELMRVAASLSPEERAAIFGTPQTSRSPAAAHKWAALADAVPDADVPRVVNACREGLKHIADNPTRPEADGEGFQKLVEVSPALAAAARESSHVRRKSYAFSLAGVCTYMQSETFAAKRAAARRQVPVTTTAAAAASSSSSAGGGK